MTSPHSPLPTVDVAGLPDPLPEGLFVLDVREDDEWAAGHIDGATHIPLRDLGDRVSEVPDGSVLVVCKVGGRSAYAVQHLAGAGLDVTNLAGGMLEWQAAGRPMVSEQPTPPRVI